MIIIHCSVAGYRISATGAYEPIGAKTEHRPGRGSIARSRSGSGWTVSIRTSPGIPPRSTTLPSPVRTIPTTGARTCSCRFRATSKGSTPSRSCTTSVCFTRRRWPWWTSGSGGSSTRWDRSTSTRSHSSCLSRITAARWQGHAAAVAISCPPAFPCPAAQTGNSP